MFNFFYGPMVYFEIGLLTFKARSSAVMEVNICVPLCYSKLKEFIIFLKH